MVQRGVALITPKQQKFSVSSHRASYKPPLSCKRLCKPSEALHFVFLQLFIAVFSFFFFPAVKKTKQKEAHTHKKKD